MTGLVTRVQRGPVVEVTDREWSQPLSAAQVARIDAVGLTAADNDHTLTLYRAEAEYASVWGPAVEGHWFGRVRGQHDATRAADRDTALADVLKTLASEPGQLVTKATANPGDAVWVLAFGFWRTGWILATGPRGIRVRYIARKDGRIRESWMQGRDIYTGSSGEPVTTYCAPCHVRWTGVPGQTEEQLLAAHAQRFHQPEAAQ